MEATNLQVFVNGENLAVIKLQGCNFIMPPFAGQAYASRKNKDIKGKQDRLQSLPGLAGKAATATFPSKPVPGDLHKKKKINPVIDTHRLILLIGNGHE